MFPLIFGGTAQKKFTCVVFINFVKIWVLKWFLGDRDFERANNYNISFCSRHKETTMILFIDYV